MTLPSGFDPVRAYRTMVRMRLVDEALAQAWADGLVPGEYHSGIGEEGIARRPIAAEWASIEVVGE